MLQRLLSKDGFKSNESNLLIDMNNGFNNFTPGRRDTKTIKMPEGKKK